MLWCTAALLMLVAQTPISYAGDQPSANPCSLAGKQVSAAISVHTLNDRLTICNGEVPIAATGKVTHTEVADVDGDGENEILIQWAPQDKGKDRQGKHNSQRLHVYRFTDQGLAPVWRGSAMSGRLVSFAILGDSKSAAGAIATLEHGARHKYLLAYRWDRFGFVATCKMRIDPAQSGTTDRHSAKALCNQTRISCSWEGEGKLMRCSAETVK